MSRPTRGQIVLLAIFIAFLGYLLSVAFLTPSGTIRSATTVETVSSEGDRPSYERMMALVEGNEVEIAYWNDFTLLLETRSGEKFRFDQTISQVLDDVFKRLRQNGVEVVFGAPAAGSVAAPTPFERVSAAFWETLSYVVMLFPLVILVFLISMLRTTMGGKGASGTWPPVIRKHPTTFADVAGHGETRLELEELKTFINDPDAYAAVGARAPRGVLLSGPPGTGKTLMAKALAGECGAAFLPVSGSDFSSPLVGIGRNKVQKLFNVARRHAPAVIFIDEIDSLARVRGADGSAVSAEKDLMLNQLLVQMDGFDDNKGVFVVAATNRIDVLDPAILRPGRFDRQIHVGLPDRIGREEILRIHLRGKPLAEGVDVSDLARGAPGFSGADIANLVNESAVHAARAGKKCIDASDFHAARDKVVMGVERRSAVLDADERKLVARHEAGHAVVGCLLPDSDPVHQATIVPRGQSLGAVMRLPERDLLCIPRKKLRADLVVLMAGRAAEAEFYEQDGITTGAESDIDYATNIATRMVSQWGMSDLGMRRMNKRTDGSYGSDVERAVSVLLEEAYEDAVRLIRENRSKVEELAEVLLDRETLDGHEVRRIVSGGTAKT